MSPSGRTLHPAIASVGIALGQCLEDLASHLWGAQDPKPGSPWDVDRQQSRPPSAEDTDPDISHHPHVAGYWYGVGGADAMLGVQACLGSGSVLSAGALSRVAMEAFAWGAWIWEPDLPLDNRIMRALLCSKHQAEQFISSHKKHLNANRPESGSGLLTRTHEQYGDLLVAELKQLKARLVTDIETIKSLPGNASSESLPSLTNLVAMTLDAAIGIPGAGQGIYGMHSSLVHCGEISIGFLLPLDMEPHSGEGPNIELVKFLTPIGEAVVVMSLYLQRLAQCWELDEPSERLKPLNDAIVEASSQPRGTLLFTPEN